MSSNAATFSENRTGEGGQGQATAAGGMPMMPGPYSLEKEKAQLEAMNRELTQMIVKMNVQSAQGLLLNVDIVSQFDPAVVQELAGLVEDCETCIAQINQRTEQSYWCLQTDRHSHATDSSTLTEQTS